MSMDTIFDTTVSDRRMKPKHEKLSFYLPPDIKLYSFVGKVNALLFGCHNHDWSRAFRTSDMTYPRPYDSHQVCSKCSATRFYRFNGTQMQAGPLFNKVIDREGVRLSDIS